MNRRQNYNLFYKTLSLARSGYTHCPEGSSERKTASSSRNTPLGITILLLLAQDYLAKFCTLYIGLDRVEINRFEVCCYLASSAENAAIDSSHHPQHFLELLPEIQTKKTKLASFSRRCSSNTPG